MPEQDEQQPMEAANQVSLELTEEMAEGTYANLAIVTHSNAEFVIDFASIMPGVPKSKIKARIIFTPMHAKRFMKAMLENVQRYEQMHGDIMDMDHVEIPMNFGGPAAQA